MDSIKSRTTNRGFRISEFDDANGVPCSVQESSAAQDEALLWLGCKEIGLRRFTPGEGWADVFLEQDPPHGITHIANTRMHLTQSQVKELLPMLEHFAEHGDLPSPPHKEQSDEQG